jgi:hypothetical protein
MIEKDLLKKVVTKSGYTLEQVRRGFAELTEGMDNWKDPISTKVRTRELSLYQEACEFFTGSQLRIGHSDGSAWGKTTVSADGYYSAIGS